MPRHHNIDQRDGDYNGGVAILVKSLLPGDWNDEFYWGVTVRQRMS